MRGAALACAPTPLATHSANRDRIRVMQLTDWLEPGGKERVAVNLSNLLPRDRYESFLCTTRSSGPLECVVAADVHRLRLQRRYSVDWPAIRRLVAFNMARRIDVLHAHGSSLFMASVASMFSPYPAVVWHDHYGQYRCDDRSVLLYRFAATRVSAVIAVNRPLAEWSREKLRVRNDRVWYVPNFTTDAPPSSARPELPGVPGGRVVCVAHVRPQKDHAMLIRAFADVAARVPDAHLLIVGSEPDRAYADALRVLIGDLALGPRISFLGQRDDVGEILAQCDVGVLSSSSEGFPLSLVEYGQAGLATVSTDVGQCDEVLDHGRAGVLVSSGDPGPMGEALVSLLTAPRSRQLLGTALRSRVLRLYRSGPIVDQICHIYDTVVGLSRIHNAEGLSLS